ALFGLGRHASYTAARSGAFPTIKINGCLVAVAEPINKSLMLSPGDPRIRAAYELCGFESPPLTAGDPATEASANSDGEQPRSKLKPARAAPSSKSVKAKAKSKPGAKAVRGDTNPAGRHAMTRTAVLAFK